MSASTRFPNATGAAANVVSAVPALPAYPLPLDVREGLLKLADESDVLIVGEMHGTREVPYLLAELLPDLADRGYQGLALEIPADARNDLAGWAMNDERPVPGFFAAPSFDGRGNAEALALVRAALRSPNGARPWQLLCFEATDDQPFAEWAERDAFMARNLAAQRSRLCPNGKIIAVCGNMHSRVARRSRPDDWSHALWPSFAAVLGEQNPQWAVRSVNIVFQSGTFYNMAVRSLDNPNRLPLSAAALIADPNSEHTLELHLPRAMAASFLAPPLDVPEPQGEK